jgi:hypothetical protein
MAPDTRRIGDPPRFRFLCRIRRSFRRALGRRASRCASPISSGACGGKAAAVPPRIARCSPTRPPLRVPRMVTGSGRSAAPSAVGSRPASPFAPTPAFWYGQAALFGTDALASIWFTARSSGDVAHDLLHGVVGLLGTSWLRRGRVLAGVPTVRLAPVTRWARGPVPRAAACCTVAGGLLDLWFLPSFGSWCLAMVAWLAVYVAAVLLRNAGRAATVWLLCCTHPTLRSNGATVARSTSSVRRTSGRSPIYKR